jgi:copper(I)-binding protein
MNCFNRRLVLAAALGLCVSTLAYGHGSSKGDLVIDHPYAPPSLANAPNGAAYVRSIRNKGELPDRLLSASTPVAARVELHRMVLDGTVMRMREAPAIDLPPNSTTSLRHGGEYHLMLVGLKQALKVDDRFKLTLNFERAGTQPVEVWVQTPRGTASANEHNH